MKPEELFRELEKRLATSFKSKTIRTVSFGSVCEEAKAVEDEFFKDGWPDSRRLVRKDGLLRVWLIDKFLKAGWRQLPASDEPDCLWQAPLASERLSRLLR